MGITEPGIYTNVTDAEYQDDPCETPSLRSSIAWKLVGRGSTPAHAFYECKRLNPDYKPPERKYFDIGKVAHAMLLGKGADYAIIHAENYLTKAAKEERDKIRAEGKVPLLEKEAADVRAMVKAARRQVQDLVDAGTIDCSPFEVEHTEKVLVWEDQGVLCRCMMDSFSVTSDEYLDEYKTDGEGASPEQFPWKIRKLGYHFRLAFYRRGLEALRVAYSPHFRIFVQETKAPYLLAFYRVDDELIMRANSEVSRALKIWRRCLETNKWPGYSVEGFDLGLSEKEQMQEHGPVNPSAHILSEDLPDSVYSGVSFQK